MDVCSVCEREFDLDSEGGVCGHIGLILFELCPTCHAGLAEYYSEYYNYDDDCDADSCPTCGAKSDN